MAHFRPQAWVHDYALDLDDGHEDFDATEALLSQDLGFIRDFKENSYDSDLLAEAASTAHKRHRGPFEVDVDLDGFFERLSLERADLTEEQLTGLRKQYRITPKEKR